MDLVLGFKTQFRTAVVAALGVLASCMAASSAPQDQGWTTYQSGNAGLVFEYPAAIFSVQKGDPTDALKARTSDRAGRELTTADGRAILQIGTFPNLDNATIDQLKRRAIDASYRDAKLDYNRTAGNWYVVSGTRGAETFYERVHFSCNGRRVDIWAVTYPTAEAVMFDALVDDMARRFRPIIASVKCQ